VVHPEPSVSSYGVSKSGAPNGYINCNILSASDGENALKLLKKMDYKIDILLTDIEMPLIDEISLTEEIYR